MNEDPKWLVKKFVSPDIGKYSAVQISSDSDELFEFFIIPGKLLKFYGDFFPVKYSDHGNHPTMFWQTFIPLRESVVTLQGLLF